MGQNEIFRPADLGLGAAARLLADACADLLDADHGAIRAALAAALAAGQWPSETLHDADLDAIREQYRRFTDARSEEHTSELQSLMRISYAVFCLKKKTKSRIQQTTDVK